AQKSGEAPWAATTTDRRFLPAGDRLLHERVVGEDQRRHRLDHWHGAREHAGIVAPTSCDDGVLVRDAHRSLLPHDRGCGLERDAEVDRLAVRDAALNAARAIGARAHPVAVHVELVVMVRATQLRARAAGADLESLA